MDWTARRRQRVRPIRTSPASGLRIVKSPLQRSASSRLAEASGGSVPPITSARPRSAVACRVGRDVALSDKRPRREAYHLTHGPHPWISIKSCAPGPVAAGGPRDGARGVRCIDSASRGIVPIGRSTQPGWGNPGRRCGAQPFPSRPHDLQQSRPEWRRSRMAPSPMKPRTRLPRCTGRACRWLLTSFFGPCRANSPSQQA